MENDIKSILNGLRYISTQIDKLSVGSSQPKPRDAEWETQSKEVANLHAAISNAQKEMSPLVTDSSGYTGKYVSLPGIIEHIKEPLGANGLSITQAITEIDNNFYLITTLRHESGQWTRDKAPLFFPSREDIPTNKDYNQECGKAISYMRRYAIESMLLLKGDREDYDNGK